MAKRRAGLHREISSIFDGVPLPKSGEAGESPSKPTPRRSGYEVQKTPNRWRLETSGSKGPSGPVVQTAASPKPEQSVKSPAGTAPGEQPKVEIASKTSEENLLQKIWQQIESNLLAPKPGVSAARQKMTVILIPVLSIALISALFKVFGTSPRGTRGVTENKAFDTAGTVKATIDWQIPEPYPSGLRDPMEFTRATTTKTTAEIESGQLTVRGILFDKDDPSTSSASINDKVVFEGDEILGAKVVKIDENSVEFEMNGRKWTQRVQN